MTFPLGTGTQEGEEGAGRGRYGVLGKEGGLQVFLVYLASPALPPRRRSHLTGC